MLFCSVTVALTIPSSTALVLWDYFIDANGLMFIPLSVNLSKMPIHTSVKNKKLITISIAFTSIEYFHENYVSIAQKSSYQSFKCQ